MNYEIAIAIAEKNELKCKVWDNRFAVFRLISTVCLLAVIVSLNQGKNFLFIFSSICIFLLYCLLTSFFHKKHQSKQKLWSSLVKSYHLSRARVSRNFSFLQEGVSPWHSKIAELPPHHMYACDLDLHQELFLFMNTCSTEGGSQKLFQLLLTSGTTPSEKEEVQKRINIAEKLSHNKSLLRRFEALRLSEDFLKSYYKASSLEKDSVEKNARGDTWTLSYAFVSIIVWAFLFIPLFFKFMKTKNIDLFLQPLFIYAIFILFGVFIFDSLVNKALQAARSTKYIQLIVKGLGKNLNLSFEFLKPNSSRKIKQMNFFVDILSLRGNPVFWILIHIFFPFDAVFCILLFFVLKKVTGDLPVWQNEIDEFDLTASFARLKSENPEFRFFNMDPVVAPVGTTRDDKLQVSNMGHPLLPVHKRICNSLLFEKNSPLILLTGSNMSGKSTFLRTFATNILLANMGAPVCAQEFLLPQMRILCAIRIDDSLSEGTSYFYAEVKRLAEILQQLKISPVPCLFFIDEIFKGTNNKERYLGSLSLLKAFLESNSFGFVSTHDLALTDLSANEPRLRNMHFREHIQDDKLTFDYTLKEGPCPTTNALYIMKLAGLPV